MSLRSENKKHKTLRTSETDLLRRSEAPETRTFPPTPGESHLDEFPRPRLARNKVRPALNSRPWLRANRRIGISLACFSVLE